METKSNTLIKVLVGSVAAIVPLVAAAWLIPLDFPMLLRQILLGAWGVGAILVAERLLFSSTWDKAVAAVGFVPVRMAAVIVALVVSLPMWAFLPLYAWLNGAQVSLNPNWLALLVGVILVNGIAEEVIHRGFIFGNLRRQRTFAGAALISAVIFAVQHLYLILTIGWAAGLSSVLLAALLAYPLAFIFEQGGNSIGAPAVLHTSSNAPFILFALPPAIGSTALIPHMAVVLVSIYLVFAFRKYLSRQPQPSAAVSTPQKAG
jgi:membrane protease YdiL (CAAX protease family)